MTFQPLNNPSSPSSHSMISTTHVVSTVGVACPATTRWLAGTATHGPEYCSWLLLVFTGGTTWGKSAQNKHCVGGATSADTDVWTPRVFREESIGVFGELSSYIMIRMFGEPIMIRVFREESPPLTLSWLSGVSYKQLHCQWLCGVSYKQLPIEAMKCSLSLFWTGQSGSATHELGTRISNTCLILYIAICHNQSPGLVLFCARHIIICTKILHHHNLHAAGWCRGGSRK